MAAPPSLSAAVHAPSARRHSSTAISPPTGFRSSGRSSYPPTRLLWRPKNSQNRSPMASFIPGTPLLFSGFTIDTPPSIFYLLCYSLRVLCWFSLPPYRSTGSPRTSSHPGPPTTAVEDPSEQPLATIIDFALFKLSSVFKMP